jgi:hypothetical protein
MDQGGSSVSIYSLYHQLQLYNHIKKLQPFILREDANKFARKYTSY